MSAMYFFNLRPLASVERYKKWGFIINTDNFRTLYECRATTL